MQNIMPEIIHFPLCFGCRCALPFPRFPVPRIPLFLCAPAPAPRVQRPRQRRQAASAALAEERRARWEERRGLIIRNLNVLRMVSHQADLYKDIVEHIIELSAALR